MKRNILLLMILTVISLGASGQKYTIYVDDFDSEIKIPNRAINLIRLAFIDGIRNTNRINVVDAVSAGSDLSLSPQAAALIDHKEMVEITHNLVMRRQKLRSRMEYNAGILKEQRTEVAKFMEEMPEMRPQIQDILDSVDRLSRP